MDGRAARAARRAKKRQKTAETRDDQADADASEVQSEVGQPGLGLLADAAQAAPNAEELSESDSESLEQLSHPVKPGVQPAQVEEGGTSFSKAAMRERNGYQDMKAYFEHSFAELEDGGFVRKTANGVSFVTASVLRKEFRSFKVETDEGRRVQFVKAWMDDETRRFVDKVDFAPVALPAGDSHTLNAWRGFAPGLELIHDENEVQRLVKPWRKVGTQLCGGNDVHFDLLEQWLAQLVQFPAERTNVAFAFVNAPKGVFKTSFFGIMDKILGSNNYHRTQNIHDVAQSSLNQWRIFKLLFVLDEAKEQQTRHFENHLKDIVTHTEVPVPKRDVVVPAHRRLVVLSNDANGLYLTEDQRRFIVFTPTDVFRATCAVDGQGNDAKVVQEGVAAFKAQFAERFIAAPADDEELHRRCINALYTHLSTLHVQYRSVQQWEAIQQKLNKERLSSMAVPPAWAKFMFNFCKPVSGGDDLPNTPEFSMVVDENYDQDYNGDDVPILGLHCMVQVARKTLWALYQAASGTQLTRNKFHNQIEQILLKTQLTPMEEATSRAPAEVEVKSHGTWCWRFRTYPVLEYLGREFPQLHVPDDAPDQLRSKRAALASFSF